MPLSTSETVSEECDLPWSPDSRNAELQKDYDHKIKDFAEWKNIVQRDTLVRKYSIQNRYLLQKIDNMSYF
jgi:hypothetical protein